MTVTVSPARHQAQQALARGRRPVRRSPAELHDTVDGQLALLTDADDLVRRVHDTIVDDLTTIQRTRRFLTALGTVHTALADLDAAERAAYDALAAAATEHPLPKEETS